jgi:hypothetical protein
VTKCGYVEKFFVDREAPVRRQPLAKIMGVTQISDMLSAAGHLCWAADDLRAAGLWRFAEEIDLLLKILDAEICVSDGSSSEPPIE